MRLFRFVLLSLCFALTASYSAASFAQNADMVNSSEMCTMPRDNYPLPDTDERWQYCDIHMRQFAYREKQNELRRMLEARAENYKASTKSIKDNYKAELEKYHASIGD